MENQVKPQGVEAKFDWFVKNVMPRFVEKQKALGAEIEQVKLKSEGDKSELISRLSMAEDQVSKVSDWAQEFSAQHVDHVKKLEDTADELADSILPAIDTRIKKLEDAVARMMSIVDGVQQQMAGHGIAKQPDVKVRRKRKTAEPEKQEEEPKQEYTAPLLEAVEPSDSVIPEDVPVASENPEAEVIDTLVTDLPKEPKVIDGVTVDSAVLSTLDSLFLIGIGKDDLDDLVSMSNLPRSVVEYVLSLSDDELSFIRMNF